MTAAVDIASTTLGVSTRISAYTQPGGTTIDSDADPGMQLLIVGGPECIFNQRYDQYMRYWEVAFTNRSGRFVPRAWVAESLREGNSLNRLICTLSQPDC
jgi:hypothetical protein